MTEEKDTKSIKKDSDKSKIEKEKKPVKKVERKDSKPKKDEKQTLPELRPGYTIKLYQKIKEGDKERIQFFEGIIIAMRGKTKATKTITVRKISNGIGVEKIYPLDSPTIIKIEVVKKARVRRSKLYYLRDYNKKLKEKVVKKNS